MGEFRMPSLGADMDAGTILEWRVQPGDVVHKGDIVAVVDTEKADIEVEVFEDGVVGEILVEVGEEVPVGTPLACIVAPESASVASPHTSGRTADSFVRASPRARRTAREAGIELSDVAGTGPGGAVTTPDLERAATPTEPSPVRPAGKRAQKKVRTGDRSEGRRQSMRRAIGELMARSKREIPHYYLATTIDMSASMSWLRDRNASRAVTERLLPAAMLLKATAVTARDQPALNGFWDDGFAPADRVHLGVAVSLREGGLVAPALHDADTLSIDDLMSAMRDLVTRARAGALRSSEMSDPTITVTNLGDQGVDEVYGAIYPPQVALVGFGRIVERPWASEGMIGVRPTVRATLAADHRVTDGHDGARFLSAIDRFLQSPEAW